MPIYNQNRSHNIDMFIPNDQVRQTIIQLSNYGGTDPDLDREDYPMRRPDPEVTKYQKADRKARKLAKQILGKDFDRLMKRKYLSFKIKIRKQKGKIVERKMYLFRDIVLYIVDEKTNKLIRICSLLEGPGGTWEEKRYSDYDKLIAFYLWLKHYKKHPVKQLAFNDQFNLMGNSGEHTVRELIGEFSGVRYARD